MSNVFSTVEQVISDRVRVPGWCETPKAMVLASAVMSLRPKVCVEIGVFGGSSLFAIALALKETGTGVVIGIDPWSNEAASEGYTGQHLEWWGTLVNLEQVYQGFLQRMNELGLRDCIKVIRDKSDNVEPPESIDLFHCDGQHSDQAVRDVERFASRVRVGGMCFMDDISWVGGGVMRSVARLKTMGFVELYRCGTGAMFQRVA